MASIISIASGKGGVGKSVVAANLSVLLAQQGKQVVLADLDTGGADCHVLVGLLNPPLTLTDYLNHGVDRLIDVAQPLPIHPNLRIIPGTGDTLATANMPYAQKKRLIRQFQDIEADVIVVDIGAGCSYHTLDFFLMADYHVAVATPDPTSVLDLYRFIKLAAIRRVLSMFITRDVMAEGLANRDYSSVKEVLDVAGKTDTSGRTLAETTLQAFQPALILNRATGRARVNVSQLKALLKEYVGGNLMLLGEIPDDPAMEQAVRAYVPVVLHAPASPAAAALNRTTEALLQLLNNPSSKAA
ncbi:MAG: P-loop NTPase [Nitrospira sp.]|nr:P-loop NTPase [Nitrospira sp.]MDH4302543.1 P-loop NTPase [Nitrospira sp.]MDH5193257.1 P-loop NTPase [Nitrospira sp.]